MPCAVPACRRGGRRPGAGGKPGNLNALKHACPEPVEGAAAPLREFILSVVEGPTSASSSPPSPRPDRPSSTSPTATDSSSAKRSRSPSCSSTL